MNRKKIVLNQIKRDTAVGLAGLALGLAIACILVRIPGDSAQWASWVQAFGSILAIVGAFFVARYQAEKQADHLVESSVQTRITETELAYVVSKDAMGAIWVANQYIRDFSNGSFFRFDIDRLTDVQHSLQSLYGRSIPSEVLGNVITIQRLVTYSKRAVSQRNDNSQTTYLVQESRDKAKARMELAHKAVGEIETWLNTERARLGFDPVADLTDAMD
ncbi:hypothetical protein [Burkholderia cepacia]|uniref:hypothetical protein n=1 Tax=Burkholderia cepacia TaxID=292 RepID=UPI001CF284BB|nr:hypothetical protein [Burkholderia cepacia]MCA8113866.1 hypothetical protein [Burkholderia cepacia]MCA8400618.1 hypothetical protein [Burkholderia cepacia]